MNTNYFSNCHSLDEVKRRYKELAMRHHPDKGGDTATMQDINNEYENICKNPRFDFAKQSQQKQQDFIRYPEVINQVIALEGIIIEMIGDWLWLSGNTYPHRAQLKQMGFYFAPKKVMWYYRPEEYKYHKKSKPADIEYIRIKYGSDTINQKKEKFELQ